MRAPRRDRSAARRLGARALLGSIAAALLALPGAPPARGEIVDKPELNVTFELPAEWKTETPLPAWDALHIKFGAVRKLAKLSNGEPATGQGGEMHVAISEAPADKDIDQIAADKDVQRLLLERFGSDPSQWPEVEIEKDELDGGIPLRTLDVKGRSNNLDGKSADTKAALMLVVFEGKLYEVRVYAWPTERDEEGIVADFYSIENGFDLLDKTVKQKPKPEQNPDAGPPPDEEKQPTGDEAEERTVENVAVGWKLVKPKGLKSKEFDRQKYPGVVAWFEDNERGGSYQILFYVFQRGMGQTVNIRNWAFDLWWGGDNGFNHQHPSGRVWTYDWPKKTKTFLALPDWEKQKEAFSEKDKRPDKLDYEDLSKLRAVEKAKNERLGSEKTIEAFRGVLGGIAPRGVGEDVVTRLAWGTSKLSCAIIIDISRRGMDKWGKTIQELLDSVEMTDR